MSNDESKQPEAQDPYLFYSPPDQRQREINWDLVVEFDDLKELFKSLQIQIYQSKSNDQFAAIEHLLKPCDPWPEEPDDKEG